jgi:hypothetical protein
MLVLAPVPGTPKQPALPLSPASYCSRQAVGYSSRLPLLVWLQGAAPAFFAAFALPCQMGAFGNAPPSSHRSEQAAPVGQGQERPLARPG